MWRNVAKESKNSLSLCIDTGGLVREYELGRLSRGI